MYSLQLESMLQEQSAFTDTTTLNDSAQRVKTSAVKKKIGNNPRTFASTMYKNLMTPDANRTKLKSDPLSKHRPNRGFRVPLAQGRTNSKTRPSSARIYRPSSSATKPESLLRATKMQPENPHLSHSQFTTAYNGVGGAPFAAAVKAHDSRRYFK